MRTSPLAPCLDLNETANGSFSAGPRPPLITFQSLEVRHGASHGIEFIPQCAPFRWPRMLGRRLLSQARQIRLHSSGIRGGIRGRIPGRLLGRLRGLGLHAPLVLKFGLAKPRFCLRQTLVASQRGCCSVPQTLDRGDALASRPDRISARHSTQKSEFFAANLRLYARRWGDSFASSMA